MTGKDSKKILRLDKRYMNVNLTLSIIIYSIVVPFCIYLSVDNYIHGKMIVARYALFCAVMTAIAVINFSICKFGKKKRDWLMHLAIQIQCFVYWITFVFFLYTGGTEGSSIFLFFVAVPVVFFFFNLVYGAYFCAVFFVIMVVYMNTPLRDMGFQFPEVYYARLPMMYLASVIMCAVAQYEVVKAKIKQEDALEAARQASEAKTDFLANTSHEIRTPINAVLGMNEMILRETDKAEKIRDNDPEAFRESFRRIRNYSGNVDSAGSNLLAIINDILDFTKIEEGRMDIVPTEYQLSLVLNDVSNMIYFKARQKNLKFVIDIDRTLPDNLYGDVVRVRQVITNVLNNAVKYTDEGSVSLTVAGNVEEAEEGKRVVELVISVTDTGIGISEDNIGKLFGKFERVDLEKNSTKEGTGLGLAITKMLLEMMDGSITVRSEYGKGSTFTISLPQTVLSDEPVGDIKEKFENALDGKKTYHESFRAPAARVLIVDDTRMNLIVVTEFLKDTGIQLDTAGGGREAVKLALANKYDVILMDQRMPEMDGVQTLQEIKRHTDGPNIKTPVICLTADAVIGARNRYLSKGFNDYLTKPIDSVYLETMLKKYIPAEKIETVELKEDAHPDRSDTSAGQIYEKLRKAGVDTSAGIRNCTEESLYMTILTEYLSSSDEKINGLNSALANGDLENYGILIHSVKSTSATIGAMDVSHLALKLEKASGSNDIDLIRKEHDAFIDKYTALLDVIRECVPQDDNDPGDDDEILEFAPE